MIQLLGVTKTYEVGEDHLTVLNGVDLSVSEGEFVSVMGPSGSGKSTLMHILGCLDVPSKGIYRFRGRSVHELSSDERAAIRNLDIGFVFQNFYLLPRMSAQKNVELPMVYKGLTKAERQAMAEQRLEEVGLKDRRFHRPSELSGGQRQRVAIARALANRPSLLLADEPTGALDSTTGHEIMELFRTLNKDGVTVIVITHDANVADYAKRVIHIRDGQIRSDTGRQVR